MPIVRTMRSAGSTGALSRNMQTCTGLSSISLRPACGGTFPVKDPGLTLNQLLQQAQIAWHGVKLNQPDWGADSHTIALTVRSLRRQVHDPYNDKCILGRAGIRDPVRPGTFRRAGCAGSIRPGNHLMTSARGMRRLRSRMPFSLCSRGPWRCLSPR